MSSWFCRACSAILLAIGPNRSFNLTLLTQPLNSSVSNGPFNNQPGASGQAVEGKRSKLGQSALLMNTYFNQKGLDTWDEGAISARAYALHGAAELVWSRPAPAAVTPTAVARKLSGSDVKSEPGKAHA